MADGGLRQLFQRRFTTWHWQSIESWSTGRGVPDLNYCAAGYEGWIELKKAEANAVTITAEQVGWAERRMRAGGHVFLAVRQMHAPGPRSPLRDALWLYHASALRHVKEGGLTSTPPLGYWPDGPAKWDWAAIQTILTAM
jgi:hypothetical protein